MHEQCLHAGCGIVVRSSTRPSCGCAHLPAARELRFDVLQSFATLRFSAIRYLQRRLFVTDTTDTDMHGVTAVVTAAGVGTAVAWFSRPHHPGTQLHELLP